jgi:toxin HigB-1
MLRMPIRSFKARETAELFRTGASQRFGNVAKVARRKLDMLHAAVALDDLRSPPGNRLEPLFGERSGTHSIRINAQWRLCFRWQDGDAWEVEIVDYH